MRTKFKQEYRAERELTQQGIECFLPKYKIEKLVQRKKIIREEPLFSQYIFVLIDSRKNSWTSIKSTRGVSGVVVFGSGPSVIHDDVISEIRKLELLPPEPLMEVGQTIKIIEGPFKGLDAIYEAPDGETRSSILINFIQNNLKIIVNNESLEPI